MLKKVGDKRAIRPLMAKLNLGYDSWLLDILESILRKTAKTLDLKTLFDLYNLKVTKTITTSYVVPSGDSNSYNWAGDTLPDYSSDETKTEYVHEVVDCSKSIRDLARDEINRRNKK